MSRRLFWTMALAAAAVLSAAAVWMGGLNQDEGWYLYAAQLVADGQMPYRDFAFTQGPVMPFVYSFFAGVWRKWGLLGARCLTLAIGWTGIVLAAALARRLAPAAGRGVAALIAVLLLGCNLYHLYYLAIPKTYALAGLFVLAGCWLLSFAADPQIRWRWLAAAGGGMALALAAGTRISLGILLPVAGVWLLMRRQWGSVAAFAAAGAAVLALAYLPHLADPAAREGLIAAQTYHAARGGFDWTWTVGSVSRLVRWYLPLFVLAGLGFSALRSAAVSSGNGFAGMLDVGFLAVWAVQICAPFPYEDYQVPVMALPAITAAARFAALSGAEWRKLLLALGLAFAAAFGSPLLEKWTTNGQDRFWSLKKTACELAQLRRVADRIRELDPGGRTLLTQDLYLAIETDRRVPKGLEMGPFAVLDDAAWRRLLLVTAPAECAVAALSGYSFAIDPPVCSERPVDRQLEYWELLKRHFELADREPAFGQNATPLLILRRK